MKGLKQLVEEAMSSLTEGPPPVEVSDEARHALAIKMREWSGWPDAKLVIGDPRPISPWASCEHISRTFTINVDATALNPNRVLLTVTPFRLKQEAVMTGVMLHEAGHARHSLWRPRTHEAQAAFVHGSNTVREGEPVTKSALDLAMLMEEPRVEGLMARNADHVGASGLGWTMRASGAAIAPFTNLSTDPKQKVMDLITSWTLRAGKQIAVAHWDKTYHLPRWVADLTSLMHGVLVEHLSSDEVLDSNPTRTAQKVIDQLILMAVCVDDRGTYMVDAARDILDMLFPETDEEDMPQPGEGCTGEAAESDEEGESDESEPGEKGDDEEGDTESPSDEEGEGDEGDPGEGDEGQPDDEVSDDSDTKGEGESDDKGDEPSQEEDPGGQAESESEVDTESDLAKALRSLEGDAKDETTDEAEQQSEQTGGDAGGEGGKGEDGQTWRSPNKDEREVQHGAERFLRSLIAPTEQSRVTLTDTPSSTIDGSAYEAWTSGGRIRAPHFFKQTRRTVEPSPPVKIAILVDVSASMDDLQEPSAMLSWALSSAALDLRNFAGRGQQVESCLIHWGNSARVIQAVNAPIPGIQTYQCFEGTTAWPAAMALVEEQMPEFFDLTPTPVNRLLVNFTDWEFGGFRYGADRESREWMQKTLAAGVHMLSVVPSFYSMKRSVLSDLLAACPVQRGTHGLIKYNEAAPGQVWENAADLLDGGKPAPFAGF